MRRVKNFFDKKLQNISIAKSFICFAIIIVFFVTTIYFYFSQKLYSENISVNLQKQSTRIEKSLIDSIEYSAYLMKYLGYQIQDNNHKDLRYIERLLASFRLSSEVNDKTPWNMFSWVDENMNLVVNSDLGIVTPVTVTDREYVKYAIKNPWQIYLGDPAVGKVSKKWIIPAGMAITNKNNKIIGIVVFGFQITKLTEKLWQSTNIEGVSFAIFDKDLNIILASEKFQTSKKILNSLKLASNSANQNGDLTKFSPFSKNASFSYYQKIPKYSYTLVTQYDADYVARNFISRLNAQLLEIFIILSVLMIIFILLKIIIINPISSLSKASKKISSGSLQVAIPKSNILEINYLANSIIKIRDYIQDEQKSKEQLKIAKQTAENANISKTTLLRSIAHDIKNYIYGIHGLTKMILDKKDHKEIAKNEDLQSLEVISDHSKELMHFVEDLLDVNQAEENEINLSKIEDCDISDIISRMILLNHGFAIANNIQLKTELDDNLPKLRCDQRRIKQVLSNLINNAIKYSKPETIVQVRAKYNSKNKKLCIEVEDQGVGLENHEIKMLLDGKGKLIDKSNMSSQVSSNGIGINTILQIVKLHNAEMKITSKKNFGTIVQICFVITENKAAKSKNINAQDKSILLVEDNPVNIKVTMMILKNAGYNSSCVENGKEALKILDEKHFDLILMDGEMPIMNGYIATKSIREGKIFKKFKDFKTIPIIALMSSNDEETLKKVLACGMNDHLEKSSSKIKILDMIKKYLLEIEKEK